MDDFLWLREQSKDKKFCFAFMFFSLAQNTFSILILEDCPLNHDPN